jgi:hypothetical protein
VIGTMTPRSKPVRTSVCLSLETKGIVDRLVKSNIAHSFSDGIDRIVKSWSKTKEGIRVLDSANDSIDIW